jgi:hypothetical protein
MMGNPMTPLCRALCAAFLPVLLLAACATPAEAPVTYAPQPPGTARLVIYRPFHYYGPTQYLTLALNDRVIGTLGPNAAIYRDVAPGNYTITFSPTRPAPNQFKTVTVAPGNLSYIRIEALSPWGCSGERLGSGCDITGFESDVTDPPTAEHDLQGVPLLRG